MANVVKVRKHIKILNENTKAFIYNFIIKPRDILVIIHYEIKMFIFSQLSKHIKNLSDWACNKAITNGFKLQAVKDNRKIK